MQRNLELVQFTPPLEHLDSFIKRTRCMHGCLCWLRMSHQIPGGRTFLCHHKCCFPTQSQRGCKRYQQTETGRLYADWVGAQPPADPPPPMITIFEIGLFLLYLDRFCRLGPRFTQPTSPTRQQPCNRSKIAYISTYPMLFEVKKIITPKPSMLIKIRLHHRIP